MPIEVDETVYRADETADSVPDAIRVETDRSENRLMN